MENKSFWWLKSSRSDSQLGKSIDTNDNATSTPQIEEEISSSIVEIIEKEGQNDGNEDIGSIIEKMNRLAAQSPLGPYDNDTDERSIEDLMKEAERIYLESSKSFEQLSIHSKTSQNLTDMLNSSSEPSTPTPKSASPLPLDSDKSQQSKSSESDSYTEDFYDENKTNPPSPIPQDKSITNQNKDENKTENNNEIIRKTLEKVSSESSNTPDSILIVKSNQNSMEKSLIQSIQKEIEQQNVKSLISNEEEHENESFEELSINKSKESMVKTPESSIIMYSKIQRQSPDQNQKYIVEKMQEEIEHFQEEMEKKEGIIKLLIEDNKKLKDQMQQLEEKLQESTALLQQAQSAMRAQNLKSPELNVELEKAIEEVKDVKEINTSLQLQLDNINKSHQLLKTSYDDALSSNKNLERRLGDTETLLGRYKTELINAQKHRDKLIDSETSLNKLLEIEKMQVKSLKTQTEKDAKCILDLNRQIKEMERIIARKHPDSVSALIVASKNDPVDGNLSARKVLEDRIRNLEQEAAARDAQSSKVFLEVQEKFNQMKLKYESHIEDLELHVSDLKDQLKRRVDSYDVYTQTFFDNQKIPEKETISRSCQTVEKNNRPVSSTSTITSNRKIDKPDKEETHLLATIRGLQADLSNKEKVIIKLQKEVDELRKTNRRLQKEREGSLKSLSEKSKEFRSYPEKLSSQGDENKMLEELKALRTERDKMKLQLVRIEDDYQQLKTKRLHDLTALQEAHEREISTYLTNITPLREQMEVQQVTISTLQNQLSKAKEELAIVTVERDHLNNRINCGANLLNFAPGVNANENDDDITILRRKMAYLEQKHQEREHRLHAIVHGLAQKNVTNRSCEQCAARQQQLIGYKAELDQLLATLRCLK